MKRWLLGVVAIIVLVGGLFAARALSGRGASSDKRKVVVIQVVQHPALNAMDQRFRERLAALAGDAVEFEPTMYANGNAETTERISARVASEPFSLAFVIGTEQARSLRSKTTTLPIVLGGATDAVGSGLVSDWDRPGGNITGTSDLAPIGRQLDHLLQLLPKASRVAIIYNPAEGNSRSILALFESDMKSRGLVSVSRTIGQASELRSAVLSLAGNVDAIYAPTDATVQSGIASLIQAANEINMPVFAVDKSAAEHGAAFAIGFDYADLGRISAEMAADILLHGADPANMPIRRAEKVTLFINPGAARRLGLTLPEAWLRDGETVGDLP